MKKVLLRISSFLLVYLLLIVQMLEVFPEKSTLRILRAEAYSTEQQELTGNSLVDFRYWKQTKRFGQPWAYMYIGGGAVSSLGCYMTSISIGAVVSGAIQTTTDFSPTWVVEQGNSRGWYYGGGSLYADKVAAGIGEIEDSNYRIVERTDQTGRIASSQRMQYAIDKINEGYTVIAHVNNDCHFVCLGNITSDGSDIEVYDPAQSGITYFSSYLSRFNGDFRLFLSDRERMSSGDLTVSDSKGEKSQDYEESEAIVSSSKVGSLSQMSSSEKESLAIALNKFMTSDDLDAVKWNMIVTQFTKLYDESVDQTLRGEAFAEFIEKYEIDLDEGQLIEESKSNSGSFVNSTTGVEVWSGMTATEFFWKSMNVDSITVGIPSSGLDVQWVKDNWGANKFYCDRVGTYTKGVEHHGIDYCIEIGTPVYSPVSGQVTYEGYSTGGGNSLHIKDSNNVVHIYYHLRDDSYKVSVGDYVKAGDQVAEVGNSGYRNGVHYLAHLHYELADLNVYDSVLADKRCINGIDPDTYEYPIDDTTQTTQTTEQQTEQTEQQTTDYSNLSSVFSILANSETNYLTPVFNSSNEVATLHDLFTEKVLFVKDNISVFGQGESQETSNEIEKDGDSKGVKEAVTELLIEMIKNKVVYASGDYATVSVNNKQIVFESNQNGFFQALLQVLGFEEVTSSVDQAESNSVTLGELIQSPDKYSDKGLKEVTIDNPNELRQGDLLVSANSFAVFDSWTEEGYAKVYEFTTETFGTSNSFVGDVSYSFNSEENSISAFETSWTLGGVFTKFFRMEELSGQDESIYVQGEQEDEVAESSSVSYWSLLKSQSLGNTMGELFTMIKKSCEVKEVYSPVFLATDSTVFYNCLFCEQGLENRGLSSYSSLIDSLGGEALYVDCYGNLCIANGSKGYSIVYPSYANPIYTSSTLGDDDIVGNYYESLEDLFSQVSSSKVGLVSADTILKNSEIESVLMSNSFNGSSQDLALGVESPTSELSAFQVHDVKNCLGQSVSTTGYRRVYDSTELLADCIDSSKGVSIPVLKLDSSTSFLVNYPVLMAVKTENDADNIEGEKELSSLSISKVAENVLWSFNSDTDYSTVASNNRVTLREGKVVSLEYPCTVTGSDSFSGVTLSWSKSFYSSSPINSLINGELRSSSKKTFLSGSWSSYDKLGLNTDNQSNLWSAELLWLALQEDSKKYSLCFSFDSSVTLGERKFSSIANSGLFSQFVYQPAEEINDVVFVSDYALDLGLEGSRSEVDYNSEFEELGSEFNFNSTTEAIEVLAEYWSKEVFEKLPISSFSSDTSKTSSLYPENCSFNLYGIEEDENINVICFTSGQDSYEVRGSESTYGQTGQVEYVFVDEYGYSLRYSVPHQVLSVYKNGYGDNLARWVENLREWNSTSLSLMEWVNKIMQHPISATEELAVTVLQMIHNTLREFTLDELLSVTGLSKKFLQSDSFKGFMVLSSILFITVVFVMMVKLMMSNKGLGLNRIPAMIKSFVCIAIVPLIVLSLISRALGEVNVKALSSVLLSTQIEELKEAEEEKNSLPLTDNENIMIPLSSDDFNELSSVLLLVNGQEVSASLADLKSLLCQVSELSEGKLVYEEGVKTLGEEVDEAPESQTTTETSTDEAPEETSEESEETTAKVDKLVEDNPLVDEEFDLSSVKGQSSYLWYSNEEFTPVNFDNYDLSVFFYFYDWLMYQYIAYGNSKGGEVFEKFNRDAESFSVYSTSMSDANSQLSKVVGEFKKMYEDEEYLFSFNGLYCKDLLGLSELFKMVNSRGESTYYAQPDGYYLNNKESILEWAEVTKASYFNSRGSFSSMKSGGSQWISSLGFEYPLDGEALDESTMEYDNSVEFYPLSQLVLGDYWSYYDSSLCLSSSSLRNQLESNYSYHSLSSYLFSPEFIQRQFNERFTDLDFEDWTSEEWSFLVDSESRVPWRTYGAFGSFSSFLEDSRGVSENATSLEIKCNRVTENYLRMVEKLFEVVDSKGMEESISDMDLIVMASLLGTFEFNKEFDTVINSNPTTSVELSSVCLEYLSRSLLELPENSVNEGLVFELYEQDGSLFTALFVVLTEVLSLLIALIRLVVLVVLLVLIVFVLGTEEVTSRGENRVRYFGLAFTLGELVVIQVVQVFAYYCAMELSLTGVEHRNLIVSLCLTLFSYFCLMNECRLLKCLVKEPYSFGGSLHLHKVKQAFNKFFGTEEPRESKDGYEEVTTVYNRGTLQNPTNTNDKVSAVSGVEFVNSLISDEESEDSKR